MQNTTIINAVRSFVNDYTSVFKSRFVMDDKHDFEEVLAGTEKKMEAQLMLEAGVPSRLSHLKTLSQNSA